VVVDTSKLTPFDILVPDEELAPEEAQQVRLPKQLTEYPPSAGHALRWCVPDRCHVVVACHMQSVAGADVHHVTHVVLALQSCPLKA